MPPSPLFPMARPASSRAPPYPIPSSRLTIRFSKNAGGAAKMRFKSSLARALSKLATMLRSTSSGVPIWSNAEDPGALAVEGAGGASSETRARFLNALNSENCPSRATSMTGGLPARTSMPRWVILKCARRVTSRSFACERYVSAHWTRLLNTGWRPLGSISLSSASDTPSCVPNC
jgi:hypothetical protein